MVGDFHCISPIRSHLQPFFAQRGGQRSPCAVQRRLSRPLVDPQRPRDLSHVEVQVVPKNGCLSLASGHGHQRSPHVHDLLGLRHRGQSTAHIGPSVKARPLPGPALRQESPEPAPNLIQGHCRHPRLQRLDPLASLRSFPRPGEASWTASSAGARLPEISATPATSFG